MTRQNLPRGRYLVSDGGWWTLYDSPGFVLDIAQDGDAVALERLLAHATRLVAIGG